MSTETLYQLLSAQEIKNKAEQLLKPKWVCCGTKADNSKQKEGLDYFMLAAEKFCEEKNYIEAIACYKNSIPLARKLKERVIEASISYHMAYIYLSYLRKFDESFICLQNSRLAYLNSQEYDEYIGNFLQIADRFSESIKNNPEELPNKKRHIIEEIYNFIFDDVLVSKFEHFNNSDNKNIIVKTFLTLQKYYISTEDFPLLIKRIDGLARLYNKSTNFHSEKVVLDGLRILTNFLIEYNNKKDFDKYNTQYKLITDTSECSKLEDEKFFEKVKGLIDSFLSNNKPNFLSTKKSLEYYFSNGILEKYNRLFFKLSDLNLKKVCKNLSNEFEKRSNKSNKSYKSSISNKSNKSKKSKTSYLIPNEKVSDYLANAILDDGQICETNENLLTNANEGGAGLRNTIGTRLNEYNEEDIMVDDYDENPIEDNIDDENLEDENIDEDESKNLHDDNLEGTFINNISLHSKHIEVSDNQPSQNLQSSQSLFRSGKGKKANAPIFSESLTENVERSKSTSPTNKDNKDKDNKDNSDLNKESNDLVKGAGGYTTQEETSRDPNAKSTTKSDIILIEKSDYQLQLTSPTKNQFQNLDGKTGSNNKTNPNDNTSNTLNPINPDSEIQNFHVQKPSIELKSSIHQANNSFLEVSFGPNHPSNQNNPNKNLLGLASRGHKLTQSYNSVSHLRNNNKMNINNDNNEISDNLNFFVNKKRFLNNADFEDSHDLEKDHDHEFVIESQNTPRSSRQDNEIEGNDANDNDNESISRRGQRNVKIKLRASNKNKQLLRTQDENNHSRVVTGESNENLPNHNKNSNRYVDIVRNSHDQDNHKDNNEDKEKEQMEKTKENVRKLIGGSRRNVSLDYKSGDSYKNIISLINTSTSNNINNQLNNNHNNTNNTNVNRTNNSRVKIMTSNKDNSFITASPNNSRLSKLSASAIYSVTDSVIMLDRRFAEDLV